MRPVFACYQSGAVLVVALLVLLLLGLLSSTVYQTNILALKMAGNDEAQLDSLQQTLAVVDGIVARRRNFELRGPVGFRSCSAAAPDPGCNQRSLTIDAAAEPTWGSAVAAVTRQGPLLAPLPVMDENSASSSVIYRAAIFEVEVWYQTALRAGAGTHLAQGVRLRVLAPDAG